MATDPNFSDLDLSRMMADQATRADFSKQLQKRQVAMQVLMAKIQTLSDTEFESAYGTLESLIENYYAKKLKKDKRDRPGENQLGLGERK